MLIRRCWLTLLTLTFFLGTLVHPTAHLQAQPENSCVRLVAEVTGENRSGGSVAWSPDGRYIAALYGQRDPPFQSIVKDGLYVFDSRTLEIVADIECDLATTSIDTMVWSPDSSRLALADRSSGDVEIWNTSEWTQTVLRGRDADDLTRQIVWSTDSQELAVVNFNRFRQETNFQGGEVVRIWDVQENVIRTTLGPDLLQAFVGQRDGEWYAALRSREEDTVRVVRVTDGTTLFEVEEAYLVDFMGAPGAGYHGRVHTATYPVEYATSAEQLLLATVRLTPEYSSENLLQVWDAATGQLLFERAGEPMIAFSALGGNTSLVIARTGYGSWEVYDLETRATVSFENRGQPGPSPNGEFVETHVLGSVGGSVIRATGDINISDVSSGETITTFPGDPVSIGDIAWSPSSDQLVVTGTSGSVSLWSLEDCLR